jgi:hypothetical protein
MSRVIHSLWPWTPDTGCSATSEPNQVGGLTATASGQTTINLSWTADSTAAPNQATSYEVERSNDGLGSWSTIATGLTTNSYSDTSLSASQTRYYRVTSVNCFGGALASASANATTASSTPTAAWSLDFSSGTPSGYTLTRASSGTYVNSSGYIASGAIDFARLTHDKNGARLGLLVEGQRTNILTRSEDLSTSWGGGDTNVTTDAVSAPNNATTADKLAATTATSSHWRRINTTSPTAGTTYVFSCFFKAGGGAVTHVYLGMETSGTAAREYVVKYDATTGARTDTDSGGTPVNTDSATQAEDMGNGWWRAWVRMEHSTGNTTLRAYVGLAIAATGAKFPSFTGAAADADFAYFWGAQVEASTTTPTSFIPTVASSVTRSADIASVATSNITGFGNNSTLLVEYYRPATDGMVTATNEAVSSVGKTGYIGVRSTATATQSDLAWNAGFTQSGANGNLTGTVNATLQKFAYTINSGGTILKSCMNGSMLTTTKTGDDPEMTLPDKLFLGQEEGGTLYSNVIIRKVAFYNSVLSDAEMQTITT